jgi:predicted Zn-dependent peptidase
MTSTLAYTLDNGLRVVLSEDRRLPIVAVCVWYDVGARDEPPARTGLAHLVEHMMFQGSRNVGPNEHTGYVQSVGGSANGDTTLESTYYVDSVPARYLRPVLWLEADRMAGMPAARTDDRLDNQRAVVINERMQRYDSRPMALAWERLMRLAHPEGHPYQHMPAGSVPDLRSIEASDVERFCTAFYRPATAVLDVVGDFDTAEVSRWIEQYFGPIPAGGARPDTGPVRCTGPLPAALPGPLAEHAVVEVSHAGLLAVYRLPPAGAPDSDAAMLAAAILGGRRNGRLRRELVVRRALAAEITLGGTTLARAPSLGVLDVTAAPGAAPERIAAAVDDVVCRFVEDGPTPVELAVAQRRAELRVLHRLSTVEGRAVEQARGCALFGDVDRVPDSVARLRPVTGAEVAAAAGRYLVPANRAVLSYEGRPARRRADG